MIASGTHTAIYRAQGDDRTAGSMPVYGMKPAAEAAHFSKLVDEASGVKETAQKAGKSESHFGFLDFIKAVIDIINPLQHIPVISTIYRHITGDEISPVARIAGDALYGGPIGAAVAVANVAVEHKTGKDIGENVFAMVTGDKDKAADAPPVQVAAAAPATTLKDIVWNDAPAENTQVAMLSRKEFPASPGPAPTKLSYRTGLTGNVPPSDFNTEGRVHKMKAAALPGHLPATGAVNVKTALHSQKAPADTAKNGLVPPELIAQQMMSNLDNYGAMKTGQMNYATFPAF